MFQPGGWAVSGRLPVTIRVSRQEAYLSLVLISAPGNCDAAAGPRARPFREVCVVQLHVMSLVRRGRYLARRGRYLACALAVAGLAAGTAVAVSPGVAQAASACQVSYTVNSDWGTGFTAAITITNNGSAITSWTLGYSYAGNQKLSQGWSGNWSQSGEAITVTNACWNGSLATGASTQIGANFSYSGTNTAPTAFTLNGTACNGTGSPPHPPPPPPPSPDLLTHAHPDPDADLHGQRPRAAAARVRQQAGQRQRRRRSCCTGWTGPAPSTRACRATASSTAPTTRRRSPR